MEKLELAERLVDKAQKLGADDTEAFLLESSSVTIQIREGVADTVNYNDSSGYGIRVLKDGRMGFASSNNLDFSDADEILARLIANTERHSSDEHNVLPDPKPGSGDNGSWEQYDDSLKTIPVEEKIKKAIAMETAAKNTDPRIAQVAWLQYGDAVREFAVASSRGIRGEERHSEVYGFVMAVGMTPSAGGQPDPNSSQTGSGLDVRAYFTQIDPEYVGRKAAKYALRMLGATEGKTGEVEGVFPPESGFQFIKLIANMVSADLVQKKKSLFSGRLGDMVASDKVTIIDDGHLKDGLSSSAIDSEGVPTTTKEIIKNGRLSRILYESYTAHKDNVPSTGNAGRLSFDMRPIIMPSNFYLQKGNISQEDLIGSVKKGIYITEVSGLHAAVDIVTGDFSIPGKGLLVNSGELSAPVTGITISGNIFDFLQSIDSVADDLTWEVREHVIGTPTFKVRSIKVGGK